MGKVDLVDKIEKAIDNLTDVTSLEKKFFLPLDNALSAADDTTKKRFIDLLNKAEGKVKKVGGKKRDWYLSEIYLRKGRCVRGIYEREKEYPIWKQAYECAVKAGNHEAGVQSSLELGFSFAQFTGSLREILEVQLNCIKAICISEVATMTRLRIIGINLYDFWRQLEFRRLSEYDLKAKQVVLDSAKSLEKAGFDDDRAAPVMILLIAKVFEFNDPAIEWAQLEVPVLDIPIPDDIKRKLGYE